MKNLDENYKKGLENFITLQEVLVDRIKVDIERNRENMRFEQMQLELNLKRLDIEEKQLEDAKYNLEQEELNE